MSSITEKQPTHNFSEQFYVDARLNFAIKHPLDWKLSNHPVSSPAYRADTARWIIHDPQDKDLGIGEMLIRSQVADEKMLLPEMLDQFLSSEPALIISEEENLALPAGNALKLVGTDYDKGLLLLAIKGQNRDFTISLKYPTHKSEALLPIFNDIPSSFIEIVPQPETLE